MELSDLKKPSVIKNKKRCGKGKGSHIGKTSGRGFNGQKSRSGGNIPAWFEGGQMPLQRRLPKRGFTSRNKKEFRIVNIGTLLNFDFSEFNIKKMEDLGIIANAAGKKNLAVKILAGKADKFKKKISLEANCFSAKARELIEKNGGTVKEI